tara:strand:- start:1491 stop:2144 length:654 start_codon:yes stop_codon:yes gene_type:complete
MEIKGTPNHYHKKRRRILGPIARFLLKREKWTIIGEIPNINRMVLIGAPHTAYRDAWFALLAVLSLDIKVKFFGARWIFSRLPSPIHFSKNLDRQGIPWPFGWLQKYFLLRLGGIPVFREENKGLIESVSEVLEGLNSFILCVAPEGGLKHVDTLRSGYYYISKKLDIPCVPIEIDFENRRFKIHKPRKVLDTFEEDSLAVQKIFDGIVGYKRIFKA